MVTTKTRRRLSNQTIGARIRQARLDAGKPQRELAELLDVTCQQICKYESGETGLAACDLAEVAKFLGLPIDWFLL